MPIKPIGKSTAQPPLQSEIPLAKPATKKRAGGESFLKKMPPASPLAGRTVQSNRATDLKDASDAILKNIAPQLNAAKTTLQDIKKTQHATHFFKTEINHLEKLFDLLSQTSKDPTATILEFAIELDQALPPEIKELKISKDSDETLGKNLQELKKSLQASKTKTLSQEALKRTFECFSNVQLMLGQSIRENGLKSKKIQVENNQDMKDLLAKRVFQGVFWGGLLGTINCLLVQLSIITAGPTLGIGPVLALCAGAGLNFLVFACEYTKYDIGQRELAQVNKALDPFMTQLADNFTTCGKTIQEIMLNIDAAQMSSEKA